MIDQKLDSLIQFSTILDTSLTPRFEALNVNGQEEIGDDFQYIISVSTETRLDEAEVKKLMSKNATVKIGYLSAPGRSAEYRYINGIIARISEMGISKSLHNPDRWTYEFELRSWLYQLRGVRNYRIFQERDQDPLKVVEKVLSELNLPDFRIDAQDVPEKQEYIVMYNEDYFNFVMRLIHGAGLTYYWDFSENYCDMVIIKDRDLLPEIAPGAPKDRIERFCVDSRLQPVGTETTVIKTWTNQESFVPNYGVPDADGAFKNFHYPLASYRDADIENETLDRYYGYKSQQLQYRGTSNKRVYFAGGKFTFKTVIRKELDGKKFIITQLKISADQRNYQNEFTAVPDEHFSTRGWHENKYDEPKALGVETATVIGRGPKGKSVTDAYGRVRIKYDWLHSGETPPAANWNVAWVRVSTPAAGNSRGVFFPYQAGDEVVVSHIHDMPNAPIIIGALHSPRNKTPCMAKGYESIIKSATDEDGNAILFDDEKGKENLGVNAKNDMNIDVNGDFNINVIGDIKINGKSFGLTTSGGMINGDIMIMSSGNTSVLTTGLMTNAAIMGVVNAGGGTVSNFAGGATVNAAGMLSANVAGIAIVNACGLGVTTTAGGLIINTAAGITNNALAISDIAGAVLSHTSGGIMANNVAGVVTNLASDQFNLFTGNNITKAGIILAKGDLQAVN